MPQDGFVNTSPSPYVPGGNYGGMTPFPDHTPTPSASQLPQFRAPAAGTPPPATVPIADLQPPEISTRSVRPVAEPQRSPTSSQELPAFPDERLSPLVSEQWDNTDKSPLPPAIAEPQPQQSALGEAELELDFEDDWDPLDELKSSSFDPPKPQGGYIPPLKPKKK